MATKYDIILGLGWRLYNRGFTIYSPYIIKKNNNLTGIENRIANVRIYQDQVSELDHDLRNDTLNQNQYNQSKLELQQRMLQDIPEENATKIYR